MWEYHFACKTRELEGIFSKRHEVFLIVSDKAFTCTNI